jgi:hypothetical protein
MSDRFPSTGPMPSRQGHAPSLSTGAAAAQQGMVRIHRGTEVRYVWPVHAAGWLSSGWRLGEERSGGTATPTPAVAATTAAGTETPAAVPQPSANAEADEPAGEPIDAHLPTNLLDLDLDLELEPESQTPAPMAASTASAEASEPDLQEISARNDVEPASFADAGQAEVDAQEPAAAASEEPAAPASEEPPQEPTPPPAPARRGRPRKGRPEAQAEPATQTIAKAQAPLLSSEGDDPFGMDPLL